MKQKEYSVLGHKVQYSVPETSAEFNALDPKRPDAACEEAVANIVYRSMNPDTRYWFLHGISEADRKAFAEKGITLPEWEGVEAQSEVARITEVVKGKDGKPRVKDGTEVTRFNESEERYYNRVLETLVEQKKFASEDAVREHFQPIITSIAAVVPFDITAPERKERGPVKLANKYREAAAIAITRGTVDKVNSMFATTINKQFTPTGDTSKMFTGSTEVNGQTISYNVSDKDAEALGWLLKEYREWKADQEMQAMVG